MRRPGRRPPAAAALPTRGAQAERLAGDHLVRHGLRLLAHNVRCRGGELDWIALDGDCVVFVEVRLRTDRRFGGAAASITLAKRRRIVLAARYWLAGAGRRWSEAPCRFDALLLEALAPEAVVWLKGAFAADE